VVPLLGVEDIVHGRMPAFALPYFLHEATHHTCLNSPVGLAMTVLEYRTRRLAETGSEDDLADARMYNARARTFLELYRPLFEGLAMFAEFDAVPGGSRIATTPMLLALDLFVREGASTAATVDDAFKELFGLVTEERMKADIFGRKERLLSEPLTSPDGYLVGYLLLKCFGTWAALTSDKFEDPDLSLGYAIHHFFDDYELVDHLLQPTERTSRGVTTLLDHLAKRLDSLFSKDGLADAGARFEDAAVAHQPTASQLEISLLPTADPLDIDPAVSARARAALVESMAALPHDLQGQLARRSLLHLTSIPVSVEFANKSFVAKYENRPLLRGDALRPPSTTASSSGSVDAFYETATKAQGLTVSIDGELVWRAFNDELTSWLDQFVVARQHVVEAADLAAARLEAAIGGNEGAAARAELITSLRPPRDDMYQHYGLLWVPLERRADFVKETSRAGFRGVMEPRLVRSLSVLALLDGLAAYLEDAGLVQAPSANLEADYASISRQMRSAFGGTPLHLERIEEDGEQYTRVRSFV
jgi:hypothetical protein